LCPFHNEKTPSFFVNSSKQLFKCFGCGEGGDVIKFVMKREGMTFVEAVKELGRRGGGDIPLAEDRPSSPETGIRKRLEKLNAAAAAWYCDNLRDGQTGKSARLYLEERGIQANIADAFGLGLSLPGWDGLLRNLGRDGYTPKEIAAAGLAVSREQGGQREAGASGYYDPIPRRRLFSIRA